ncbi:MAG: hypothetical protein EOM64_04710 [Erysipelotrichia bacterium]|nr:hypothetical protein [Erysipelotrichia bacterium]
MKKAYLSVFALTLFLAGCSGGRASSVTGSSEGSDSKSAAADSKETAAAAASSSNELKLDDLGITEYKFENDYATEYLLAVKNNSSLTATIMTNATAYDASGNMLGAADGMVDDIGPGEESCMTLYFNDVKGIDHIEYRNNMQYKIDLCKPVLSGLSVQQAVNGDALTLAITNNNEYAAEFVQGYAVFLDANNNAVGMNNTYFCDANYEIAAGATQSATLDYYYSYSNGPFDHVVWYLTGRASK